LNLTGEAQPNAIEMTLPGEDDVGLWAGVKVRTLSTEDAAATLAAIARGEVARCILAWIPLMRGGGESGIIESLPRWSHTMPSLPQLIDNYLAGPQALRQAVAGMTREQVLARPVPGKWSTLEVVCHLADFEPVFADRMKRVIALDNPTLLGADENRFAAALAYQDRDLDEELTIIDRTRQQMARILRQLPPEALQRVGVHSEKGPRTLEELLVIATNHIPHHVKFILDKRKALGLLS
jgi:uncharacterized damage-inducible protein DinB